MQLHGVQLTITLSDKLTALAPLQPAMKRYPVRATRASILQQDWTVTVFRVPVVAVTRLLLTQHQERLWRDQVGTVQEHAGRLQHAAAGQNLYQHTIKFK